MQNVVEVPHADRKKLRHALRLRGSVKRMITATGLSRQAIINFRDLGRCEEKTVQRVREYLEQQNAATV